MAEQEDDREHEQIPFDRSENRREGDRDRRRASDSTEQGLNLLDDERTKEVLDKIGAAATVGNNPSLRIVVVGGTGVGKTTLVKSLFENDVQSHAVVERTVEVDPHKFEIDSPSGHPIEVTVTDTPALVRVGSKANRKQYKKEVSPSIAEADIILYCLRMDDCVRESDAEMIRFFLKEFGARMWAKVVIVLTFANRVIMTLKIPEEYKQQIFDFDDRFKHMQEELCRAMQQAGINQEVAEATAICVAGHPWNKILPGCDDWICPFLVNCLKSGVTDNTKAALLHSTWKRWISISTSRRKIIGTATGAGLGLVVVGGVLGANPIGLPRFGDTPLHQACKQGWLDIVEILIERYGCDPNMVTESNQSLLHYACQYEHIDIVTLLIEKYGCDPNVVTESNESLLHYACRYGHIDIVMLLIERYGCDPNAVTCNSGENLLHYACRYSHIDIVKLLIEKYSFDPNTMTKSNESLLHYAYRYGHVDIVMLLIEKYGCDPNAVTESGENLLHYACRCGQFGVVKLLIEKCGCDPSVTTKSNQTLLHYACQYGNLNIDIIKYLINKQHLNPLIRDSINQSEPLDYAINNNKPSIAVYLCQCISSDEMLSPNRIKTTINLITFILRTDSYCMVYGCIEDRIWKTANGDNILQLVGSSKMHIAHMPSAVILMSISHNASCIIEYFKPDLRTADGETIIQLVCQSETIVSQISSEVMMKWLSDSTDLNDMKIDTMSLKGTTAGGNNLLEVICQSEKCLTQIYSTVFFNWLRNTVLHSMTIAIPDCRTADGDTLLQLILQSEMPISRISSGMLVKLLSNSREITINEMKNVNPNWTTVDGAHFPHVLCLSNIENDKVTELMQYYIMENGWNPDTIDGEGNTVLHIACQNNEFALVSYLINQAHCNPNIENHEKSLPVDLTTGLEATNYLCQHYQVSVPSKTISKWLNNQFLINDTTMLQSLVNRLKTITNDGSTLLHDSVAMACTLRYKKRLFEYLLTECHCDPNCLDSKGRIPLQLTSDSEIMKILVEHGAKITTDILFKVITSVYITESTAIELLATSSRKGTMLWNPTDVNRDGDTALELADAHNKPVVATYLLTEAKCDPSANYLFNSLLEVTRNLKIAKLLIENGARVTPKLVLRLVAMESEPNKCSLIKLLLTLSTWNPDDADEDGYSALHLACKDDHPTTVNLLLSVAQCDPNIKSKSEEVPIQLTSDLRITKTLVEHGAQLTTDVVLKLISKHHTDSRVSEFFEISIARETMLRNPNYLNSDGYTVLHLACEAECVIIVTYLLSVAHCDPNIKGGIDGYTALHLACKAENSTIVNHLLSVGHCDPNINSDSNEVPLQLTTNSEIIKDLIRHGAKTSIMYKSYKKALGTNKPLQPPVKVFVVGNPSVGKSTLTAALKTERGIIAQLFSSGKVTGVDEKTVGIVPHDFESGHFGRVTLYDFAGHREFYSGHAALLQTAIQSTPPIFLLVVKLSEDDKEIIKHILYWISFLENQCASVTCRPHIILVGSHADALKEVNPKDKVNSIISTLDTKCFTNMVYIGFVAMNCKFHESTGMSDLRHLLIKSCQELRVYEPITFNAHCFLVYLIEKFISFTAVTIRTVSESIRNQQSKEGVLEFLPTNFDALYKICLELNDRGHILLLKDRTAVENSYNIIVIDKEFLLSKISGTMFAPEGFKQYKDLSSNTGVVPLSKIAHCFPESKSDTNILIAFFTHLEFCHEILDQALLRQIAKDHSQALDSKERYYLFPGLISLEAERNVWETESHFSLHFGWTLQCTNLEQFLTSRFLQVLLLRLAFSLALESKCDGGDDVIGIHRKCSIWKNGIFWGREFCMETLVEVIEDKSIVVISRFQTVNLEKCLKHRSEVISIVLECHNRFCPRVSVAESFIDASSPLIYPFDLNSDNKFCTVHDLSQAIVSNCESPSVVLSCGKTVPAERFLSFEPYTEIEPLTLQELWDENESKIISDKYLLKFVQKATDGLSSLIKAISGSSTSSKNESQLYQDLLRWRDGDKTNKKTYKDLRQAMDQYSVFAGRNVLVSITKLTQILLTRYIIMYVINHNHNNRILCEISINHYQMTEKRNHKLIKTKIYFQHRG